MSISFNGKNRSETPERSGLNYKSIFTGATLATPLIFNPNASQIKSIKNLPDTVKVDDPDYNVTIEIKDSNNRKIEDKAFKRVSLLTKFNPNELLSKELRPKEGETKYADNYYIDFDFLISSSLVTSVSGKALIIDGKMNSAWIKIDLEKLKELYNAVRIAKHRGEQSSIETAKRNLHGFVKTSVINAKAGELDVNYGVRTLHEDSCRVAREGEQILVKLIFDMSDLIKVPYKTVGDLNTMKIEKENDYNKYIKSYNEFDMSDIEQLFDLFLEKDYDSINSLIFDELKSTFTNSQGKQCKVGIFLGARGGSDGKVYQGYYRPKTKFGEQYTFKKPYENYAPKEIRNFTAYGATIISRDMAKSLTDEEYGYDENFQKSFEFLPFNVEEVSRPKENKEIDDFPSFEDFGTKKKVEPNPYDDLPF